MITPTFTANFDTNFGTNATAARAAWAAAAQVFTSKFSGNININITVDAVAGTSVFGQSSATLLPISYADLLALVKSHAATQNDQLAIGAGGSMTAVDPTNGHGTWWLTRAQAKALGHISDDMSEDGMTTFGAGNPFTFSGGVTAGTYDFQGIAAHEISEVMGRLGLSGGTVGTTVNSFSLIDNFSYTGAGTKGLRGGPGENFSIDNGTTLLKLWNDPTANHLDSRDWAPGTNDAFNQFSASGVVNGVSAIDLQLMDVIGYNLAYVEWLSALYADLLGRTPDAGGLAYWEGALFRGQSLQSVASSFLVSTEYCTNIITGLYQQLLSRAPDAGGLAGWAGTMEKGTAVQQIILGFCNSTEYQTDNPLLAQFVESLYQRLLGRPSDPGGKQFWVDALAAGKGTAYVINGFVTCEEYCTDRVTSLYSSLLGRAPDPAGLAYWVKSMVAGTAFQQIQNGFLTSVEYQTRALQRFS